MEERGTKLLGDKADGPISDIVKADLVAYRNHLASRVSARTNRQPAGPLIVSPQAQSRS